MKGLPIGLWSLFCVAYSTWRMGKAEKIGEAVLACLNGISAILIVLYSLTL